MPIITIGKIWISWYENKKQGLSEREMELVKLLMADCKSTENIQAKLKRLFVETIKQMMEAEMDEYL